MQPRVERRATRIRKQVRIDRVLARYGYRVHPDVDREQQFSCDLHGDGTDSKPSARCYPESNNWHCWACARSRDAIQTVREKEGLGFVQALDRLEQEHGLDPLPWEDGDDGPTPPQDEVGAILDAPTVERIRERTEQALKTLTLERSQPFERVVGLWELFDRARLLEDQGDLIPMQTLLRAVQRLAGAQPTAA